MIKKLRYVTVFLLLSFGAIAQDCRIEVAKLFENYTAKMIPAAGKVVYSNSRIKTIATASSGKTSTINLKQYTAEGAIYILSDYFEIYCKGDRVLAVAPLQHRISFQPNEGAKTQVSDTMAASLSRNFMKSMQVVSCEPSTETGYKKAKVSIEKELAKLYGFSTIEVLYNPLTENMKMLRMYYDTGDVKYVQVDYLDFSSDYQGLDMKQSLESIVYADGKLKKKYQGYQVDKKQ